MRSKTESLARRLARLRHEKEWSQSDLASRAGLTADAVRSVEQGRRPDPRASTALKLARALGVTLEALLDPPPPAR
jgi:transcriptional regulator with XRE-family HTH domain